MLAVNADTRDIPFDQLVDFLKTLHARGFYKSLHLKIDDNPEDIDIEHVTNIISTLPGLDSWSSFEHSMLIDLSRFANLKELHIATHVLYKTDTDFDLDIVAKSLTQLERLSIYGAWDPAFIAPFIRYSNKLKSIKLSSHGEIYLFALDEERKKLDGACRIVIYLREEVYLRTKWASRNVHLSHIELRRIEGLTVK